MPSGLARNFGVRRPQGMRYLPWLLLALALHGGVIGVFGTTKWRLPESVTKLPSRIVITDIAAPGGEEGVGAAVRSEQPPAQAAQAAQSSDARPLPESRSERRKARSKTGVQFSQNKRGEAQTKLGRDPWWQSPEETRADAAPSTSTGPGADNVRSGNGSGAGGNATESSDRVGSGGRGSGVGGGRGADARAYCLHCPAPTYPAIARQRSWSGVVRVWLELAQDGTVRTARLDRSSGYEVLDREALAAARRSRFRMPPEWANAPAAGTIEYRFELVP